MHETLHLFQQQTPTKVLKDPLLLSQLRHSMDPPSPSSHGSANPCSGRTAECTPTFPHLSASESYIIASSAPSRPLSLENLYSIMPNMSNTLHPPDSPLLPIFPKEPYHLTIMHSNLSTKTSSKQCWINKSCTSIFHPEKHPFPSILSASTFNLLLSVGQTTAKK